MSGILESAGLTLDSADELLMFSTELVKYGGFEGAGGGMLGVQAVLHGGGCRETAG